MVNIGEKLCVCRKKAGMSQDALASELRISRQAVSRWETGEAVPDTEHIKLLCQILHVSADYLLFDERTEDAEGKVDTEKSQTKAMKIRFRLTVYTALLVVGVLSVIAAMILALIETYQPYQTYYTAWGPYGSYLFRSWRIVPLVLGLMMAATGAVFLRSEYKNL